MKERAFLRPGLRSGWTIAGVGAVALLGKLLLALKTYGTNDVYSYDQFSVWSRYLGVSLYHLDPLFNHPPSMIHVLHGMSWLAGVTGLPFAFWLRVPAITADAANLWLVWKLLGERVREQSIFWALVLLAATPTLILVSGFHGNTDSVVMFFVLLSVYLVEKDSSPWAAGAALGLAHCVKVYPLIAAPAILLNLPSWNRRIKFCAAAAAVVLITWAPFIYQDPRVVLGQVFGYRSSYGMWGLSYIADNLTGMFPRLMPLNAAFEHAGAYLSLGLVCAVSWRMSRSEPKPQLFSQIGLVFILFLSVSCGFGVQYLAWLAPWVVEQGWLAAALFYSTSGVFLFLVYNLWAQGFPWYLADSYDIGTFVGYYDYSQLLCWISLLMVLWLAWKEIASLPACAARSVALDRRRRRRGFDLRRVYRYSTGAIAYARSLRRQIRGCRALHQRAQLSGSRSGIVGSQRYQDSIQAAREAIALTPESADEANEIIAADETALGMRQR